MTSSRLPGKVLLAIAGKPALQMQIERVGRSEYLDDICIATTTNSTDDSIVALAQKLGAEHFRGSEGDVLSRVLGAAQAQKAEVIVQLTGDCPFTDPALVDRAIEEFFSGDYDYASNIIRPTFPNGFDVQVFPTAVLADVAKRTNDIVDRTHVSYYIYMHPEIYRCHNWEAYPEERGPELRVTLDEQADYEVLQKIAEGLLPTKLNFTARDVVSYLHAHPEIVAINENVRQKEPHEL